MVSFFKKKIKQKTNKRLPMLGRNWNVLLPLSEKFVLQKVSIPNLPDDILKPGR